MNPVTMTIEQLEAELAYLDSERLRIRERAKALRAALTAKLVEEHADEWGLTPAEYARVKASKGGAPLHAALNEARKAKHKAAKAAQSVTVDPTAVAAAAQGV